MSDVYNCCKDCEKRHPLCHADCPDKAAADALYEEQRKERMKGHILLEYKKEGIARRLRRKNLK